MHTEQDCPRLKCLEIVKDVVEELPDLLTNIIQMYYSEAKIDKRHTRNSSVLKEWLEIITQRGFSIDLELTGFGSSLSGFGTKTSDFDFCVKGPKCSTIEEGIGVLSKIEMALAREGSFKVEKIFTARIPVLKFNWKHAGLEHKVDISVSNKLARWNTSLLKTYARFDDRVAPLVVAVKKWANSCEINNAANRTFSSYALTIMAIHFLQSVKVLPYLQNKKKYNLDVNLVDGFDVQFYKPPYEYIIGFNKNAMSLGELFINFFEYYNSFDWDEDVVQIREKQMLGKFDKGWTLSPIAIEDPFELTHNLTHGIRYSNYWHIKKCINATCNEFRKPKSIFLRKDFTLTSGYLKLLAPQSVKNCFKCGNKGHFRENCPH